MNVVALRWSIHHYLDTSILADLRALSSPGQDVLADVMRLFLADVPVQLVALTAAIDTCDVVTTGQVAHRLRGSALSMGAWRMAKICGMVECAARLETLDPAAAHAAELAAEFESTRLALELEVGA